MCSGHGKHQILRDHSKQTLTWAYGLRWRPHQTPCCRDVQLFLPSRPLPAAATLPTKTDLAEQERTALLLKHWRSPTEALRDAQCRSVAFGSGEGTAGSTPEIICWNSRYECNIPSLFGHLADPFVQISQPWLIYFFKMKMFFTGGLYLTRSCDCVCHELLWTRLMRQNYGSLTKPWTEGGHLVRARF